MQADATEPLPAGAPRVSDRTTIALVDDDRNILTTVSIALQAEGFATRVYSDGEAALKAICENPPDFGVFDIKMPRMDGMELLRRVRAQHPALDHLAKGHTRFGPLGAGGFQRRRIQPPHAVNPSNRVQVNNKRIAPAP